MADARDGRWAQAERGFRRAIQLDPNRSRNRLDFGMWFLDVVGRTDEGIEQLRRAQSSDLFGPDVELRLAWLLMSAGRYDAAAQQCARMPAENVHRSDVTAAARDASDCLDRRL